MAISRATVARWLEDYVKAWEAYDPAAIGALFSEDATYAFHPWDEPVRGRDAIVRTWLDNQDAPGSFTASYAPIAIDGNLAVASGTSRYFKDGVLDREYYNVFLIRFDDAGRCSAFTEYFMKKA
jgi:ketosteroid isomerase-like protein